MSDERLVDDDVPMSAVVDNDESDVDEAPKMLLSEADDADEEDTLVELSDADDAELSMDDGATYITSADIM